MGKKTERLANRLAEIYSKDRQSGAKNVGNLAASLKRTVSAIGGITERKFMSGLEVVDVLTADDREALQKAARILSHLAGEATVAKRMVKRTETEYKDRYERLLREARVEVAKVLASASVEDMIVGILWRRSWMVRNLDDALRDASSPSPRGWSMQRSLEHYLQSALDDLIGEVASDAASKNVPLADVLTPMVARLKEHRPKILERDAVLIARIKNRCEQEAAGTTETK